MKELFKPKRHRQVPWGLRFKIYLRDRFRCKLCGRSPMDEPDVKLEIDHIIPFSKGGTSEPDNLQTLCKECNRAKHAMIINRGDEKED